MPQPAEPDSRERLVLNLAVYGMANLEIAHALVISVLTVKAHLDHCQSKLGVTTREATIEAWRRRNPPPPREG